MKLLLIAATAVCLSFEAGQLMAQDFGKGTEAFERQDYEAALREWAPLAKAGNAAAQYKIGTVFHDMGAYDEALKWYQLAAAGMDVDAQYMLGAIYDFPLFFGFAEDYQKAFQWYRLAAIQGHVDAQQSLAAKYQFGTGVLQDHRKAHMWYNIASANGAQDAKTGRDTVSAAMTREDISAAQAMANTCMSSGYMDCGW